jgi:hypothetical protein
VACSRSLVVPSPRKRGEASKSRRAGG